MDSSRFRSLPGARRISSLPLSLHDGDAGGIVAAIFEALQAVEDQRHYAFRADVSDNAAHGCSLLGTALRLNALAAGPVNRLAHRLNGTTTGPRTVRGL